MVTHAQYESEAADTLTEALLDRLEGRNQLNSNNRNRAVSAAAQTSERVDRVLIRLGLVQESTVVAELSALTGVPIATAQDFPDDPILTDALASRFLRHSKIVPISQSEDSIRIAMADPLDDQMRRALEAKLNTSIEACFATPTDLDNAIERLYGEGRSSIHTLADTFDVTGATEADTDVARLRDQANDAPVIQIVNLMIRKAVELKASDIHVEPFDNCMRIRLRVDGQLQDMAPPPSRLHAAMISRIKIMAHLDIAERRLPQDGRVKAVVAGKEIDLRVATSPTLHGEAVVMRILDRDALALDFETLGFTQSLLTDFKALLSRPHGIVLVTGPTGSGKTTTLYAALQSKNDADRKIITVEDPVEYQIAGVNQIQVRPDIGLGFPEALRSILRQDPDIIMIGEIRDLETARIAIQAALTGHLVLATLHTNSAAGAISRLIDMGVEDYLLASTLNGVLAQRLVRRLCESCKTCTPILPELLHQLDGEVLTESWRASGCNACNGRGSSGRIAVSELLMIDDVLREAMLGQPTSTAVHSVALKNGMKPIHTAGLDLVREGTCSLEDVLRVTIMGSQ